MCLHQFSARVIYIKIALLVLELREDDVTYMQ